MVDYGGWWWLFAVEMVVLGGSRWLMVTGGLMVSCNHQQRLFKVSWSWGWSRDGCGGPPCIARISFLCPVIGSHGSVVLVRLLAWFLWCRLLALGVLVNTTLKKKKSCSRAKMWIVSQTWWEIYVGNPCFVVGFLFVDQKNKSMWFINIGWWFYRVLTINKGLW